jgi:hypothetical protein
LITAAAALSKDLGITAFIKGGEAAPPACNSGPRIVKFRRIQPDAPD